MKRNITLSEYKTDHLAPKILWAMLVINCLTLLAADIPSGSHGGANMRNYLYVTNEPNLKCSLFLRLEKNEFKVGDQVGVEIYIRNDSHKSFRVYLPGLVGMIEFVPDFDLTGAQPFDPPMAFGRVRTSADKDWIELEQGELFGLRFFWKATLPGNMTLSARYRQSIPASKYLLFVETGVLKVTL